MAYNKYTWKSGDVISSARLNNIEDGIEEAMSSGGGVMIVNVTKSDEEDSGDTPSVNSSTPLLQGAVPLTVSYKADKTYEEIKAAIDDGQMVVACFQIKDFMNITYKTYFYCENISSSEQFLSPIKFSYIDTTGNGIGVVNSKIIIIDSQNNVSYNELAVRSCFLMGTNATHTEKDGESQTTYSNTGFSYSMVIISNIMNGVNVILNVNDSDKIMIYTVSEYYPNDQVIAFSGAGKVGPLYMDKNGNISETYPTSSGSGGDVVA